MCKLQIISITSDIQAILQVMTQNFMFSKKNDGNLLQDRFENP